MNFEISEQQRMLRDTVAAFLEKEYRLERRCADPGGRVGRRAMWRRFCELGLVGLPFAPDYDGISGGSVENMLVLQAFGGALVVEPYLSCVVMAGNALGHLGDPDMQRRLLPRVAAGDVMVAWSHSEAGETVRASRTAGGWALNGERRLVLGGGMADQVLVTAVIEGGRGDGWGIFLVDIEQPGVGRSTYLMPDGHDAADLRFVGAEVTEDRVIGQPGAVLQHIAWVQDLGVAGLCAEAVGAMAECLRTTVEHMKTRQQFGVPLSTMQALQHKAADMLMELEMSRSMTMYAAACCNDEDVAIRAKALSAAKVRIGQGGRFVGQASVQMHGAIGMTEDCKVGHLLRRLVVIDMLFGDSDAHLQRLADAGGLIEAATW